MEQPKPRSFGSQVWELSKFVISVLIIVIPIRTFVAKPFIVSGASMYPTFKDSEYLIVDELSYYLRTPERGEVVIFKFPKDEKKYFIKRIIGLPGETLTIKNNKVTIKKADGQTEKLDETYVKEGFESADMEVMLEPNEYFVMGDNRNVSYDSRSWGAVPQNLIAGRAFIRLFPPTSLSLLPGAVNPEQF